MNSNFYSRTVSRFFSGVAGVLVAFLGMTSSAPAFAAFGEWSTPVNLSEAGSGSGGPQIAIDGSGNAVAIWRRYDGNNDIAQSSWSDDGGASWSASVSLSEPGEGASNPRIVIDESGVAHAMWNRYDGNDGRVQYTRTIDGGVTWSAPVNLSTSGGSAQRPHIAVDGSGNLIAVWVRDDGNNDIAQASRSTNSGVSWSTPVDLSLTGENAGSPRVAADGSGNIVAVWTRSDGSNQRIQASRSTNGGASWSTPAYLSESGVASEHPRVAIDDLGNAIAVWAYDPYAEVRVQASKLAVGSASWSAPVNVSAAGNSAATPQVAIDGSGTAVAVWRYYGVDGTMIQSSRLASGGASWSVPAQLSVYPGSSDNPQVAASGSGNAVAVWQQSNGSNPIIRFSQSTDGGLSWTVPTELSEPGQSAITPEVAVDESGNAVALWRRSNGDNDIIQASRSSAINGGGGGEGLANTGAGDSAGDTALIASAGLLALGVLTRVVMRRREVANLG